jgi:TonB family protein
MKLVSSHPRAMGCAVIAIVVLAGCAGPLRQSAREMDRDGASQVSRREVLPRASATNGSPIYPINMRLSATPALVSVDCVIGETGRVLMASVAKSTNVAFNQPTLDAVRSWTFEPGTRDGVATAMHVTLPVEYIMER